MTPTDALNVSTLLAHGAKNSTFDFTSPMPRLSLSPSNNGKNSVIIVSIHAFSAIPKSMIQVSSVLRMISKISNRRSGDVPLSVLIGGAGFSAVMISNSMKVARHRSTIFEEKRKTEDDYRVRYILASE